MKTRGESLGEPKRPRPDFREIEKGIVVVGDVEGAYDSLREGPEGKFVEREKEVS